MGGTGRGNHDPKLASGKYRLYSRRKSPKTGRRRNLGTFAGRKAAGNTSARCSISSAAADC
jgi:hypothetical protein